MTRGLGMVDAPALGDLLITAQTAVWTVLEGYRQVLQDVLTSHRPGDRITYQITVPSFCQDYAPTIKVIVLVGVGHGSYEYAARIMEDES